MSNLRVYALGGAGINIAHQWKLHGKTKQARLADIVGLDTSDANIPADGAFPVFPLEGGRGSGKNRAENIEGIPGYIEQAMNKHKPGTFNIISFSSSSSGGLLAAFVARFMMQHGHPFMCLMITDTSTTSEQVNTAKTYKSLDGQVRQFNTPIAIDRVNNDKDKTRGEVNAIAVRRLDLMSFFMNDLHDQADYSDIKNLLTFNQFGGIPATLVRPTFVKAEDISSVKGNFVAAMSVYDHPDNVRQLQQDVIYRSVGIATPELPLPEGAAELHMLFEYDDVISQALKLADEVEDTKVDIKARFKATTDLGGTLDDNGMDV